MWKDIKVKDKTLWHITKKDYSESIKEKGIIKSKMGQVGPGVYAIIPDLDVLNNLIEFFDIDRKNTPKDLVVVEFTYTGEVVESPVEDFIFANEGWVKTETDIPAENINSITDYTNFGLLEKTN